MGFAVGEAMEVLSLQILEDDGKAMLYLFIYS